MLRVFFAAFIAMVNTMFQVFALNFATSDDFGIGFSNTFMLWLAIIANLVAICTIPFWARLSDRVGRKPVFVTGVLGSAVLVTAFLGAIAAGNHVLTFVLGVLLAGVVYSMPNAVWPATYAEYFPTRVRLSGMAIGTQFGFALAGFTPTIAGWLMAGQADNWVKVAAFACGACVISAVAVITGPTATHTIATREIGVASRVAMRSSVGERGVTTSRAATSFSLGLVGAGIGASLTPADAGAGGPGGRALADLPADRHSTSAWVVADLPEVLAWARAARVRRAEHHPPVQAGSRPAARRAVRGRRATSAPSTPSCSGTAGMLGRNTDWSGYSRAFRSVLPGRRARPRVLVGAGGAGVAVGYGLLRQGAEHVAVLDTDLERATACVERLAKRFGDDRVSRRPRTSTRPSPTREGVVNATPIGMYGHPGSAVPADLLRDDLWVSDVVYFPLETELVATARGAGLPGAAGRRHGRPARRSARSSTSPAGTPDADPDGAPLRGADRPDAQGDRDGLPQRRARATSWTRSRGAGFDAVELFDNDLISSPMSPREVAARCADLGLGIALFQPVRDVEGVAPERFDEVLHRLRTKLDVMAELGTTTLLACSNAGPDAVTTSTSPPSSCTGSERWPRSRGVTVAFEALAWGRHVNRVGQAWEAVVSAPTTRRSLWPSTPSTSLREATTAPRWPACPGTGSASCRSRTHRCST